MPINYAGLAELVRQEQAAQKPVPTVGQPASEQIILLPAEALADHPYYAQGIPYKPASEERIAQLAESIRRNGILTPLLVRPLDEAHWQILGGHNRRRASVMVGLWELPCIIKDADDNEAIDILITDNLLQRIEGLLPSEKAQAYKMKLDVLRKRQGERTDLTSTPVGQRFGGATTVKVLAQDSPDSATQIQRYIRLTYLIPELLDMVDEKKLGLRVAVVLSYLCEPSQRTVCEFLATRKKGLTQAVADELRQIDADPAQEITPELLRELVEAPWQRAPRVVKIQMKPIRKFFPPNSTPEEIATTITQALECYFSPRGGESK